MGILNITHDSFYAQSRCTDNWLSFAENMIRGGASILDVGGESTRPGNTCSPSEQQELDRILPVVEGLSSRFDVIISIDTSSPLVMTESVKAGAGIINDVRALRKKNALQAAAKTDVPIILMHSLLEQPSDGSIPTYQNVISQVSEYLMDSVIRCESAGISKDRLILDPGFGGGMFGKNTEYNLYMLKNFNRFHELGFPLLAGLSRKSFIGEVLNREVKDRLPGSLAAAMMAFQAKANILRVHDVWETVDVLSFMETLESV